MPPPKIIVKRNEQEPEPVEVMAQAIIQIAAAMDKISKTRLTRRAIVVLIQANSGLNQGTINIVLDNLADLEKNWLKPATSL